MSELVRPEVRAMDGSTALPTANGELQFAAPWEGRAFGLAMALVDRLDLDWDEFRQRLIVAIADEPERPYYESWVAAVESLATDHGLVDHAEVVARVEMD